MKEGFLEEMTLRKDVMIDNLGKGAHSIKW